MDTSNQGQIKLAWDYINQGGPIMYILLVLNIVGVSVFFTKLVQFKEQRKIIKINARDIIRGILSKTEIPPTQDIMLNLAKDKALAVVHHLGRGQSIIKMIAAISPLLGLLGTVVGILASFQVIAKHGLGASSGDFAGGISTALITTVGGLIVAIPHFIFHGILNSWLNNYEVDLEDEVMEVYLKNEYQE